MYFSAMRETYSLYSTKWQMCCKDFGARMVQVFQPNKIACQLPLPRYDRTMQCELTDAVSLEAEIELPSSLIVTNLPMELFSSDQQKGEFEQLFKNMDETASFHYLSTFRRCRVQFRGADRATAARIHLDFTRFHGKVLRCFFSQVFTPQTDDDEHFLKLPQLEKQFLISPPASPPVGWEQSREAQPGFNFELLSRLAALAREESTVEVVPASENCPSIKIYPCADDDDVATKPKIVHTARPPT